MKVPGEGLNKASGVAGTHKPWPQASVVSSQFDEDSLPTWISSRRETRQVSILFPEPTTASIASIEAGASKNRVIVQAVRLPSELPRCSPSATAVQVRLLVAGSSRPQVAGGRFLEAEIALYLFCPVRLAERRTSSNDDWTTVQHASPPLNLSPGPAAGLFVIVPAFVPQHSPFTGHSLDFGAGKLRLTHARCPCARGH